MNCYFKFANRVPASQVSDRVTGQEKNHFRFTCGLTELPKGISLVG